MKPVKKAAKWLCLAVLFLAAGCFYSCGGEGGTAPFNFTQIQADSGSIPEAAADEAYGMTETAAVDMTKAGGDASQEAGGTPEAAARAAQETVTSAAQETGAAALYVYVCGAVYSPGVYELAEGQRLFEALKLAGGFTEDAADDFLNLAMPVMDGMKVYVPTRTEAAAMSEEEAVETVRAQPAADAAGPADDMPALAKVNINTATKEELMTLNGIGESRAADIIAYRESAGGFSAVEDIMNVPGIKEGSFEKIRDYITV